MSLDRIARITINLRSPPLALASYRTPLIAAALTSGQIANWGDDLVREFTPQTYLADLETIGVTSSEDLYVSLVDLFSQSRKPALALVGQQSDEVAQVNTITVVGTTNGNYVVTINGVDFTFPASSNTATQIRDGLLALVNGGTEPVTAGASGAGAMTLTADVPGASFTVSVASPGSTMTNVATTASVGLSQDLVAFKAERNDWYYVLEHSRNAAVLLDAAATVEAMTDGKLLFAQTNDANGQVNAATSDLGARLRALGYSRTAAIWHPNNDEFVDHALVGKMAPAAPGSETYANKELVSVTGFLPTSETTLENKRYSWLERFTAADFSMSQGGWVASGQWIDLIVARDFLKNLMQIRMVETLRNAGKIPYTDIGAQIMGSITRSVLTECASAPYNIVDPNSITVDVPKVSQQTETDRGNRHYPNVNWGARVQGAIHTMDVTGDLAP